MARASVKSVLGSFRTSVQQHKALVGAVRARGVPFFRLEQIAELSYLRTFLAWETFLEDSFARFLCGAKSGSGFRPVRYASPANIAHAHRLVRMGPQRVARYGDWGSRDFVLTRANLLFKDGKPYAPPLQAAGRDVDDMRIIRNRVAHRSEYARSKFDDFVLRRLGVPRRLHPGRFLLMRDHVSNQTYLDFFSDRIILVADQIAG